MLAPRLREESSRGSSQVSTEPKPLLLSEVAASPRGGVRGGALRGRDPVGEGRGEEVPVKEGRTEGRSPVREELLVREGRSKGRSEREKCRGGGLSMREPAG